MARRGRKPGFILTDEHRAKIQNSNILNALIEHVEGKREMSATQVQAGIALLKKILPDMATVEYTGGVEVSYVVRIPQPSPSAETWLIEARPQIETTQ